MTTDKHQVLASDRLRDANEHLTLTALEAQQRAEDLAQRNEDQNKIVLKKRAMLRELVSQLTVSEQRERKRLAAELHDYLAQMLVLGRLKIGQARHQMSSIDLLKAPVIEELDDILCKALVYIRTLMAELSPTVLHELGLPPALKWLACPNCHGRAVRIGLVTHHHLFLRCDDCGEPLSLPERVPLSRLRRQISLSLGGRCGMMRAA